MSLNYGTLKTRILGDGHRAALGDAKAADFVRAAEGHIARELRASEMIVRGQLTDAERVDGGIYSLPADFLKVAERSPSSDYKIVSDREVEFFAVPPEGTIIRLDYFARLPTFEDDTDVNVILTRHEDIYIDAGLAALHTFTEDLILADAAARRAQGVIDTLNDQARRLLSTGRATRDTYNFRRIGSAY